jgi:hypothetical protein
MARKLKNFKFDVGNSSTGPIGMVLRVYAYTKAEAVVVANAFLASQDDVELKRIPRSVEYCNIYFGKLTINQIETAETEDMDDCEALEADIKGNGTGIFVANGDELCIPCGYSHAPGQHHAPVK